MDCGVMNPGILSIVGSISKHHAAGYPGSEIDLSVPGSQSIASDVDLFALFTTIRGHISPRAKMPRLTRPFISLLGALVALLVAEICSE